MRLSKMSPQIAARLDPDGGFLCLWTHWRPSVADSEAEGGGEKLTVLTYLPCPPDAPCLCGSGKQYRDCCRPKPYMVVLCPDPGVEETFSLCRGATITLAPVDGEAVRQKLLADERFKCTEDTPERGFWTYLGDPYFESEHGILCFGDVELQHKRKLIVTGLSETRMQVLLGVFREMLGDDIKPKIRRDAPQRVPKPGRKQPRTKR